MIVRIDEAHIQYKLERPLEATNLNPVTGKTDLDDFAIGDIAPIAVTINGLYCSDGRYNMSFINKKFSDLVHGERVKIYVTNQNFIEYAGYGFYDSTSDMITMSVEYGHCVFTNSGIVKKLHFEYAEIERTE